MARGGFSPWFGLGLAATGAVLAAMMTDEGQRVARGALMQAREVLRRVSHHEGTYTSINANTDGAGVSYGIIQWTQISGNLGRLLQAMRDRDPGAFDTATEGRGQALLDATRGEGLRTADGELLWSSTWRRRLVALGNVPAFREVQEDMALQGEHWRGAEDAAATLGIRTARSMALFYDTSVQQGPGKARSIATKLRAWADQQSPPLTPAKLLESYAWLCAAPFRATQNPGTHPRSPRLQWRQVGAEWHVFAGKIDLYADITRRRNGILADATLSDDVLA